MSQLLSELLCRSFLIYPSKDPSETADRLRHVVWAIKADRIRNDGTSWIEYTVRRLVETSSESELKRFFCGAALVPVPGSKKTLPLDRIEGPPLWTAKRICEALLAKGLGERLCPCVHRSVTVESSKRNLEQRTPGTQAESLVIAADVPLIAADAAIIVVDDVVTTGSTMLATASLAIDALGERPAFGFAIAATEPYLQGEPIQHTMHGIRLTQDRCQRRCVSMIK